MSDSTTRPKVSATPTCVIVPVKSLMTIAPVPAKTRANVPRNSAVSRWRIDQTRAGERPRSRGKSLLQCRLDRFDDFRIIRLGSRLESTDHVAFLINNELREVPGDLALVVRLLGQIGVQRIDAIPLDDDLRHHRERHAVFALAELLNLLVRAR